MQVFLYVIYAIAALLALLLLLALLAPRSYAIERSRPIACSRKEAYEYLRQLKNQDQFSKWVMMDPGMKKTFRGTDGTVGFVYAWEGNRQAGKGEQEIKQLLPNERIDIEIRFIRPFSGLAHTYFIMAATEDDTANTLVKWGMRSRMNYPMNILLLFTSMDKMLGPDLQSSLEALQGILEKKS